MTYNFIKLFSPAEYQLTSLINSSENIHSLINLGLQTTKQFSEHISHTTQGSRGTQNWDKS